jgi:hypothetical protein
LPTLVNAVDPACVKKANALFFLGSLDSKIQRGALILSSLVESLQATGLER